MLTFLSLAQLGAINWTSNFLFRISQFLRPQLLVELPRRFTEILIDQTDESLFRVQFKIERQQSFKETVKRKTYRRKFEIPRPKETQVWEQMSREEVKAANELQCAKLSSRFPIIPPSADILDFGRIVFSPKLMRGGIQHTDGRFPIVMFNLIA